MTAWAGGQAGSFVGNDGRCLCLDGADKLRLVETEGLLDFAVAPHSEYMKASFIGGVDAGMLMRRDLDAVAGQPGSGYLGNLA